MATDEDRKTGKRAHLIHALDTYLNGVWFRDDMTDDEADEVGDAIDDTIDAVINALNQAMDEAENTLALLDDPGDPPERR